MDGSETRVFDRPRGLQCMLGNAASEDDGVHGKLIGPEMGVEKMEGKDEADREQRLFAMHESGDVEYPAWQKPAEEERKPQQEAGEADDSHHPEHDPVVELLPA